MIEIVLHNPTCKIAELPTGERALILEDPTSHITVTTSIDREVSKRMGDALRGDEIKIADLDDLRRHGGNADA